MSQPNMPDQNARTQPDQAALIRGQFENQAVNPLIQLAQSLAAPFQGVFNMRQHTQAAKQQVKDLSARVERLEAEIEAASGKKDSGQRFDRFR